MYAVKIADRYVKFVNRLEAFYYAERQGQDWSDIIDLDKALPLSRQLDARDHAEEMREMFAALQPIPAVRHG